MVAGGLVHSLARPGGNLTGVTSLNSELGPKRLALLHEMIPSLRAVAVLLNPANAGTDLMAKELRAAAGSRGLEVDLLHAAEESEFEKVFASAKQRSGGLVIGNDSFFISRSERLAALALQHALPAVFTFREFAAAGGLMSYGGELADGYRLAGIYTGQILKGRKPGDLPVQQSTKVELIINLKTARALGLTIPLTLLGRADEVIE
jgi:putative ABC transport system substrate-binding protein